MDVGSCATQRSPECRQDLLFPALLGPICGNWWWDLPDASELISGGCVSMFEMKWVVFADRPVHAAAFTPPFALTQKLPLSRGKSTSSLRHKQSSEANMSAISRGRVNDLVISYGTEHRATS